MNFWAVSAGSSSAVPQHTINVKKVAAVTAGITLGIPIVGVAIWGLAQYLGQNKPSTCNTNNQDYLPPLIQKNAINVAVVGDRGVGKTTIIDKMCCFGDGFEKHGTNALIKKTYINQKYEITFCEISEDLETLEKSLGSVECEQILSRCHYALIVFDLSEGDTLAKGRIQRWKEVIKCRMPLCDVGFIPNKVDLIPDEETYDRLGTPIARFAGDCEREAKYPRAHQDFCCFPVSALTGKDLIDILNHICDWGKTRIRDFEKFGIKV